MSYSQEIIDTCGVSYEELERRWDELTRDEKKYIFSSSATRRDLIKGEDVFSMKLGYLLEKCSSETAQRVIKKLAALK